MDEIIIYTDGGCKGNPGVGAWAFVMYSNDQLITEQSSGVVYTTNNQMELTAVIVALRSCLKVNPKKIIVNTDSQYVKNGITTWVHNWKKNGWKTANKKPVKNKELWVELDQLNSKLNVTYQWVKGHAGIDLNERCDTLVNIEMDKLS
ncbi:MAG: ribonuclease HI [Sphaerochaetaceae bacterium]|nr:ribonuclease HI [Sphaerochaetaceae bacterium]MDC7237071.1 ribonuclease HI [Sphaerochaetaceae bacterium]MDC7243362.1 ribonuclease HI [Sphaerochaetaceae bacterium]